MFKFGKDMCRAHVEGVAYHFYVNDSIRDPEDYTDLIDCLYQARPSDSIYIHLNSNGGRLDITMQIINAMKSSDANVTAIADGEVASAATLILFSAPRIGIQDFSYVMLHDGAEGLGGKINENVKQALFTAKLIKKIAYDCYQPFFSEEEIDGVLEGKDMWLTSDEVMERIKKIMDEREEDIAEE